MSSPPPSSKTAFLSLYRAFLRTTNHATLQKKAANLQLRAIWRPAFDDAARDLKQLEDRMASKTPSAEHIQRLQQKLRNWEVRVDNTLSLLANSAQTRGLPHQVVSNLANLRYLHNRWFNYHHHAVRARWDGQLPPDSEKYHPRAVTTRLVNKHDKAEAEKAWDAQAFNAMSEVIHMAEQRDGLHLGRAVRRRVKVTRHNGPALV